MVLALAPHLRGECVCVHMCVCVCARGWLWADTSRNCSLLAGHGSSGSCSWLLLGHASEGWLEGEPSGQHADWDLWPCQCLELTSSRWVVTRIALDRGALGTQSSEAPHVRASRSCATKSVLEPGCAAPMRFYSRCVSPALCAGLTEQAQQHLLASAMLASARLRFPGQLSVGVSWLCPDCPL